MLLADAFPDRQIVFFDPRMERSHEPLLNRLRQQDFVPAEADLLVIRGSHADFAEELDGESTCKPFVGQLPVVALCGSHDAKSRQPTLHRPMWAEPSALPLPELDELRQAEVEALLRRSNAVMKRSDCHYNLPSSTVHAESFVRLADALQDHTDLVRMADWLLEYVEEGSGLAADTGSLIALLLCVRDEARRRYMQSGDREVANWELPIATLDAYPARPESVRDLIDNFRAAGWKRLVFVISVSSTGNLKRKVEALGVETQVVTVCDTTSSGAVKAPASQPDRGIRFADYPIQTWPIDSSEACERCAELQLLHVHPETYEVTARLDMPPLGFLSDQIQNERPFWATADRTGAVRLHQDCATNDGSQEHVRHLGVALDVAALLRDPEFEASCRKHMAGQRRPDVVLVPRHPTTDRLRGLATDVWPDAAVHEVGLQLTGQALAAIGSAGIVAIVDDVCITGHTLSSLRHQIYGVSQAEGRDIGCQAFVVVSRPSSGHVWEAARKAWMYEQDGKMRHGLCAGAQVLLPAPGIDRCPWCRERRLLQSVVHDLPAVPRTLAEKRIVELRATPLRPPLTPGGVDEGVRTHGSVFGALAPEAAVAASSSHAQALKEKIARDRDLATIPVFDLELFLAAIFDAVLVAGTLRSLDGRHVKNPQRQSDVATALNVQTVTPALLLEFAYAVADSKLPGQAVIACAQHVQADTPIRSLAEAIAAPALKTLARNSRNAEPGGAG